MVVGPDRIVVEARISSEELFVVATVGDLSPTEEELQKAVEAHGAYVLNHLQIQVDGKPLEGTAKWIADAGQSGADDASGPSMYVYRLEYPLSQPPRQIRVEQDFLRENKRWTAPCELRMRQSNQNEFRSSLLLRGKSATLDCTWTADTRPADTESIHTEVQPWPTFCAYMGHGIEHILTGYDHLLFVTGLVLAATSLWDLLKVVTAFTVAHSLTLVLSVFNIVHLSEHVVEPMIAASIVFVAVQNIFWPERSTGWNAIGRGLRIRPVSRPGIRRRLDGCDERDAECRRVAGAGRIQPRRGNRPSNRRDPVVHRVATDEELASAGAAAAADGSHPPSRLRVYCNRGSVLLHRCVAGGLGPKRKRARPASRGADRALEP